MPRIRRWIGIAEVKFKAVGVADSAAFVPVVGDAADVRSFFDLVSAEFKKRKYRVVRVTDIDLLSKRKREHRLAKELLVS